MTVLLHRRTSTDSTTGGTACTVLLRLVVLLHEVVEAPDLDASVGHISLVPGQIRILGERNMFYNPDPARQKHLLQSGSCETKSYFTIRILRDKNFFYNPDPARQKHLLQSG